MLRNNSRDCEIQGGYLNFCLLLWHVPQLCVVCADHQVSKPGVVNEGGAPWICPKCAQKHSKNRKTVRIRFPYLKIPSPVFCNTLPHGFEFVRDDRQQMTRK